jgi:hypothetical protein
MSLGVFLRLSSSTAPRLLADIGYWHGCKPLADTERWRGRRLLADIGRWRGCRLFVCLPPAALGRPLSISISLGVFLQFSFSILTRPLAVSACWRDCRLFVCLPSATLGCPLSISISLGVFLQFSFSIDSRPLAVNVCWHGCSLLVWRWAMEGGACRVERQVRWVDGIRCSASRREKKLPRSWSWLNVNKTNHSGFLIGEKIIRVPLWLTQSAATTTTAASREESFNGRAFTAACTGGEGDGRHLEDTVNRRACGRIKRACEWVGERKRACARHS